jgi:glycosyltransferase involved in cell wall biosynthesis
VLSQDYPGKLEVAVICDGCDDAPGLSADERVRVLANQRVPGLAGARNTGVLALETDLIACCDDDDQWLPAKLREQVAALNARPGAVLASCGIVVESGGKRSPRLAGRDEVTYEDLVRSRMVMVHSSTYLMWRDELLGGIGLFDETIPHGQNEDWDIALRAASRNPIAFVDRPLVRVTWHESSHFSRDWEARAEGVLWMLDRHPDIARSRIGAARVYGQLAFAYACLGRHRDTLRWARRALRQNWHERRVPIALAVATGCISGESILRLLGSYGHGI